ncbi:MAG: putative guanidinoacetate methyltransferase [uncultured marine phage]|uniref:Putative guanidinoacetate methyltransferase n=1 Tax=uncultured marine phage TaxID=707152 RepID=A0A8D9CBY1_9VIRU|nr:MAG: putative guanidinoacetate methyltransferase [uncultured marine phage]
MHGINSNSDFVNSNVTFHYDEGEVYKITSDLFEEEIMMGWESSIMEDHSNIVCHNQGDILEIGFGMGISADFIQSLNPSSHTIIEIHPQIYSKLEEWADGKSNVTIINDDWWNVKDSLGNFDGIFYDTIWDLKFEWFMRNFPQSHMKSGGKFSYFNIFGNNDKYNLGATFSLSSITPDSNNYFNESSYYVPTVQF